MTKQAFARLDGATFTGEVSLEHLLALAGLTTEGNVAAFPTNATDAAIVAALHSDINHRYWVNADGSIHWADGATAFDDVSLSRTDSGVLTVTGSDLPSWPARAGVFAGDVDSGDPYALMRADRHSSGFSSAFIGAENDSAVPLTWGFIYDSGYLELVTDPANVVFTTYSAANYNNRLNIHGDGKMEWGDAGVMDMVFQPRRDAYDPWAQTNTGRVLQSHVALPPEAGYQDVVQVTGNGLRVINDAPNALDVSPYGWMEMTHVSFSGEYLYGDPHSQVGGVSLSPIGLSFDQWDWPDYNAKTRDALYGVYGVAFTQNALENLILSAWGLEAGDPFFSVQTDGKMQWGDGAGPQDVTLARIAEGNMKLTGSLDNGLEFDMVDATEPHLNASFFVGFGEASLSFQHPAGTNMAGQWLLTSLRAEDDAITFTLGADGSHSWGGGSAPGDTFLYRPSPGALQLLGSKLGLPHEFFQVGDDVIGGYTYSVVDGANASVYAENDLVAGGLGSWVGIESQGTVDVQTQSAGSYWLTVTPPGMATHKFAGRDDGAMEWGDGTAARDVTLRRAAAKVLEIPESGGGLKLTSPDGATHKTLTINNAGALTLV